MHRGFEKFSRLTGLKRKKVADSITYIPLKPAIAVDLYRTLMRILLRDQSFHIMQPILKSSKLANVCYDIRGPVLDRAKQMEEEGHHIIKLNIGNPASFGFDAPEEILQDVIHNLSAASGYCDSKGLFAARKAIMHYTQEKRIQDVRMEDIYIGNGVSELIVMAMQALLNTGDEVLVPSPDYPLWTAAVVLAGGTARHYVCDEQSGWLPDLDDIRAKVNSEHSRHRHHQPQ